MNWSSCSIKRSYMACDRNLTVHQENRPFHHTPSFPCSLAPLLPLLHRKTLLRKIDLTEMWYVACKDRSGEGGVGEICHFDEAFDDEVDSGERVKEQVAYTKNLDDFHDDVLA